MRLIDADVLINKIKSEGLRSVNCGWSDSEIESDILDMIYSAPTVMQPPRRRPRGRLNNEMEREKK
jgi:hypothetical protein